VGLFASMGESRAGGILWLDGSLGESGQSGTGNG
jgi:hypothetical protein